MKSVPNIISSKDLSYIEDMLNWKFILIKKINNYIEITEDNDIKKVLVESYENLLDNFDELMQILK